MENINKCTQKKPKNHMSSFKRMRKKLHSQRKDSRENGIKRKILKKWVIKAVARMLHNNHFYEQRELEMFLGKQKCLFAFQSKVRDVTWLKRRKVFSLWSSTYWALYVLFRKRTCSSSYSALPMFCTFSVSSGSWAMHFKDDGTWELSNSDFYRDK